MKKKFFINKLWGIFPNFLVKKKIIKIFFAENSEKSDKITHFFKNKENKGRTRGLDGSVMACAKRSVLFGIITIIPEQSR